MWRARRKTRSSIGASLAAEMSTGTHTVHTEYGYLPNGNRPLESDGHYRIKLPLTRVFHDARGEGRSPVTLPVHKCVHPDRKTQPQKRQAPTLPPAPRPSQPEDSALPMRGLTLPYQAVSFLHLTKQVTRRGIPSLFRTIHPVRTTTSFAPLEIDISTS